MQYTEEQQQLLKNPEKIPAQLAAGKISLQQIPDPHWNGDACIACHSKNPVKGNLYLRDRDVDRGCNNCHATLSDHSYIHPSNVRPTKQMLKRMSSSFRQSVKRADGDLSCITCHDLPMQCKPERAREKRLNPRFFRDGPYRERTNICFQCHDNEAYTRLNPHDQVTDEGKIRKERCGICHKTLDGLTDAMKLEDVDFNLKEDLSKMCTGCHPWKPHPGGAFSFGKPKKADHLVKMPGHIQAHYDETQEDSPVLLPLEPGTGKVFCGTCHNPHESGVIKNEAAAAGADSKKRLRVKDICVHCHDK